MFDEQDPSLEKEVGIYEIESINNPCLITTVVNPKEYFEQFKNSDFNKKQKGIRKKFSKNRVY